MSLGAVPCSECALRRLSAFAPVEGDELAFIQSMKRAHFRFDAGATVITNGQERADLYTLYSGWAYRFKSLPDGRRQILNFFLPGDLVGLQASMFTHATYDVVALTDIQVCVFSSSRLWDLFRAMPTLAFDVTWLGARSESLVDDNLTSVGARSAAGRVAALLVTLFERADTLQLVAEGSLEFPLTQQHIADALGLSLVHTNKTIARFKRSGLIELRGGRLAMSDRNALRRIAQSFESEITPRPLV